MVNKGVVSFFRNLKGILDIDTENSDFSYDDINNWKSYAGNSVDCTFKPDEDWKRSIRNHFIMILNDEEILFLRDLGVFNMYGLVITDRKLVYRPDKDSIVGTTIAWSDIQRVEYKDSCLYFRDYDGHLLEEIHIKYFTKSLPVSCYESAGTSIAETLTQAAALVEHTDPFKDNVERVDNLIKDGKKEEAISLVKSLIPNAFGETKAKWYLKIGEICGSKEQAANYSLEGLEHCKEDSPISICLRNLHKESIASSVCTESSALEDGQSNVSMRNIKMLRRESFWLSQANTDEAFADGFQIKEAAKRDFMNANSLYCEHFARQPYNERKVLLVVKEYSDLRQDNLCVMRKSDIPSSMSFPIGHPQEGQLYVGHPFNPAKYVLFEEYQLELVEDRVREFCWLMQCLGATRISISANNAKKQSGDSSSRESLSGEVSSKIASVSASVSESDTSSFAEKISKAVRMNQEFEPVAPPYIPEGQIWYQNEPSWQRLVNQRMVGSLMHASECIETKKSNMVSSSELSTIKAELKTLISASGEWSSEEERKYQQQENATLNFEIEFAPIERLSENSGSPNLKALVLTNDEREYLEEVKAMLEDGDIDERGKKTLSRFATKLGISPDRALELERALTVLSLTDDEKEYLEEVKYTLEDGEIGPRERKSLNRCASRLGISSERAKEIESYVTSNPC